MDRRRGGDPVRRLPLEHGWTVRAVGGSAPSSVAQRNIPASVPGVVHVDLLAAGLIPDPYLARNAAELGWIGETDWRYETDFTWDGVGEHVDLVADGLDTFATLQVNGTVVGRTANMHRYYRFDVRQYLRKGPSRLAVTFAAPLPAAMRAAEELGPRPNAYPLPFNAVRKMACNFGWDWGPELVTAGIWRPIRLESWSTARIASVRPLTTVAGTTGVLTVHVDVDGDVTLPVTVHIIGDDAETVTAVGSTGDDGVAVEIPDVALWWPVGHGPQPLYEVTVTLGDGIDIWRGRIGFRIIEMDTSPDADGTRFVLAINGRRIWVPRRLLPFPGERRTLPSSPHPGR